MNKRLVAALESVFGFFLAVAGFLGAVYGVLQGLDTGNPLWLLLGLPLVALIALASV